MLCVSVTIISVISLLICDNNTVLFNDKNSGNTLQWNFYGIFYAPVTIDNEQDINHRHVRLYK